MIPKAQVSLPSICMIISNKTSKKDIIRAIYFKAISFSSTPPTTLNSPIVDDSRITKDLTTTLNKQATQLASVGRYGDDAIDNNCAVTILQSMQQSSSSQLITLEPILSKARGRKR